MKVSFIGLGYQPIFGNWPFVPKLCDHSISNTGLIRGRTWNESFAELKFVIFKFEIFEFEKFEFGKFEIEKFKFEKFEFETFDSEKI